MANRKRKLVSADTVYTQKKTRLSLKAKQEDELKASLPILTDEKLYSYNDAMKTYEDCKVDDKYLRVVIPKVKISCEPLNVEKFIDFGNSENVGNTITNIKKKPGRKSKTTSSAKTKTLKSASKKGSGTVKENSLKSRPGKKRSERKSKVAKEAKLIDRMVAPFLENAEPYVPSRIKKIKILINGSPPVFENKSSLNSSNQSQEKNYEENLKASTFQSSENQSSSNLNVDNSNTKETTYSSIYSLDDETAFIELNDINLEELAPSLENISDEELKMKLIEGADEKNKNVEVLSSNVLLDNVTFNDSTDPSNQNGCDQKQGKSELESFNKNTLENLVEAFMKNPQLNYLKENTALKKGLCFTWLSNNYVCSIEHCLYSHNALSLFTKKLKQYPSKFVMIVVISMRNDILFVDVIMAAFKILSERRVPTIWVTFLIYFVYYVTEPSDPRFLKFWVNAARFFCQLDRNYAGANGFASLLSIFSQGQKSEEWKIIEFINLIKQPPVQVSTTYALLQPVLHMNLPSQLLIEAIESSVATREDLLKVYSAIVPKISFMTSPIQVVELLLRFCIVLEEEDLKIYADDLRRRLRQKVESFKSKITQREYPLTALFQEELSRNLKEGSLVPELNNSEEVSIANLAAAGWDSNYFELQEDFYHLMSETLKLSPDSIPSPFRTAVETDKVLGIQSKEEDVCERQITRIKQFFRDCQFDLLGKYLNELRSNVIERATEVVLKLLLRMKISLQQVVDLVKIIVLPCKSENAAKIIASVSLTLILNFVRINDWKKAYIIASLCKEKDINLVTGKVFYLNELNTVSQCRIVLLLIEIYAYKSDYETALALVKEHSLFSSDTSLWNITWKQQDKTIRIRIIEDLLRQIVGNQLTKAAYDLFEMIWKAQNKLFGSVDLGKSVNEVIILLLNEGNEDAVNLYDKIKTEVHLKDTAARAILVTLVRQNRLSEAKSLLLSVNQNVYFLPKVQVGSVTVRVSSFWLEEEIYVMFDAFFDSLIAEKKQCVLQNYGDVEVHVRIWKPNRAPRSNLRPLCLGIIKPFFKEAYSRIQRVLQYQFSPPLKLIFKPLDLKLDGHALRIHLEKRMSRNAC